MSRYAGVKITLDGWYDSAEVEIFQTTANTNGSFILRGIDNNYTGVFINITDPRQRYLGQAKAIGTVTPDTALTGVQVAIYDKGDQSYSNPTPIPKRYSPMVPTISTATIVPNGSAIKGNVGVEGVTAIVKSGFTEQSEVDSMTGVSSAVSDENGDFGIDRFTAVHDDCALFFDDSQGRYYFLNSPSLSGPRYILLGSVNPGTIGDIGDISTAFYACGTIAGNL